ncbi:MAG: exodeoxyribonuclease V subunit gamma, partial [Ruminococcus sp.]|nr:exodeoxyribonuclease V subunit gamma [Ruminococcus sp.]
CIITSFSKEDVLAVLKSGLTLADSMDVSLFENYVFTWNISGKAFFSEFTANPRGFADKFTTDDMYELTKVETLRNMIITPLLGFADAIKNADVRTVCTELYNLMLTLSVDEKVKSLCSELDEKGYHYLSEEQTRLWQVFTDTLDRTVMVAGDRKFAPRRFLELLNIQFSAQDMAFIPHSSDQVTVGDIERLRLSDKKVVFVIGAVEGEFPKAFTDSGIFTSQERETLSNLGVLADTSVRTWVLKEQYLCYYALTSASEKLFVSYPCASLTGTPYQPSQMITEIIATVPSLSIVLFSDVPTLQKLWSAKSSFSEYSSRVSSSDELTKALEEYYSKSSLFEAPTKALKRASARAPFVITDKKNAQNLFGKDMSVSASQVEKYHLCRFQYFCNYGLRVRERRAASIDAMEYGSFVHYILEKFIEKYTKEEMCSLSDSAIGSEVKSLMYDYAQIHFGGTDNKSERFMYLFNRVSASVNKLIKHLIEELSQSSFTPVAFELDIGKDIPAYELTLPTGQKVTIKGKVDRADILRKDGKVYIRIVDYKTGSKVFSLSDIMYGLNLQMLIYLSAITKNNGGKFGTDVIPAGVLYMPSTVSVINAAFTDSIEKIEKERNKKLRMNGLILSDLDVIEAMERNMSGVYIPVSSKGEKVSGADNLATLEEFGAVFARIDKLVSEMALELSKGSVEAIPAKHGYDACEYCPYISV